MPLPKKIPHKSSKKEKRVIANRYEVKKRLGHGNYGTAWLVQDHRTKEDKDKLKVLKEIPIGELHPDETLDVKHEADLQRNLDHPSIVKFYDCFMDAENFCIVTEYCEGGDLDVKIHEYKKKGQNIPEAQVVEWLIQLLLAVQYMHDRRVLHRDLKARNVFLRNNMIKIGDFGISRILMGTTDMASTFIGTPFYMSPEVLKHEGYNAKSDVWSLGCLLYELVALKHAFDGQSLMGVMYKIVEGDLPEWPKQYSQSLQEVFQKLLIKDPAKRPSASEVLKMPFIASEIEQLKNTMIKSHRTRSQRDKVMMESDKIVNALKEKKTIEELQRESEEKKWRNLPPRERMRIQKQRKADEEAKKLALAAQVQLKENKTRSEHLRQTLNPYKKHDIPLWATEEQGHRRSKSEDLGYSSDSRPFTAPMRHHSERKSVTSSHSLDLPEINEQQEKDHRDSDEEADDDDDDDDIIYYKPKKPLAYSLESPLNAGATSSAKKKFLSADDRPITPLKDKMVYDMENSSLDWKDGIPDKPDLAEEYYSQFYDDFENGSDEDAGSVEGTLVAGDPDKENLIYCLEKELANDDTIKSQTLVDDTQSGAFGPVARETKIRNLRIEGEKKLGKVKFEAVYKYLKEARFANKNQTTDESVIMNKLGELVKNPTDCFIVDQLLFLEYQANAT